MIASALARRTRIGPKKSESITFPGVAKASLVYDAVVNPEDALFVLKR
jgi:hypothetical protein